jgi:hypothetical protein
MSAAIGILGMPPQCDPHWAIGGGVEDDTNDVRRIRRQKRRVKLNHQIPGHHAAANAALRGGAVNARIRGDSPSRSARSAEALTAPSTAPKSNA